MIFWKWTKTKGYYSKDAKFTVDTFLIKIKFRKRIQIVNDFIGNFCIVVTFKGRDGADVKSAGFLVIIASGYPVNFCRILEVLGIYLGVVFVKENL